MKVFSEKDELWKKWMSAYQKKISDAKNLVTFAKYSRKILNAIVS